MTISIVRFSDQNPRTQTYVVNLFNHSISTTITAKPSVVRWWIMRTLRFCCSRRGRLVVRRPVANFLRRSRRSPALRWHSLPYLPASLRQQQKLIDLRDVAEAELGIDRQVSMEGFAVEVLEYHGVVKDEWVGRGNWAARWLSEEQMKYACVDAAVSFLIGKELKAWNWN
ncbi:hypothetical protein Tsubulata_029653 [Turnera subulata]|uniref:3'-5' exonuclease domain-containing protein n=1 Tax=Turnera subulata TaxID=218843 RepID=A0A9Q0JB46_9ROSI|nr:hypothetical protein Tsubulata_029653 [Turnera subulata]